MNQEEEMQDRIANGNTGQSQDELAYRIVFRALSKDDPANTPSDLADRVILKLEKRNVAQKSSFDLIITIMGALFFLVGLIASVMVTGFKPDLGFLMEIADFKGLFLFGIGFIIVINLIDKQLMRKKRPI